MIFFSDKVIWSYFISIVPLLTLLMLLLFLSIGHIPSTSTSSKGRDKTGFDMEYLSGFFHHLQRLVSQGCVSKVGLRHLFTLSVHFSSPLSLHQNWQCGEDKRWERKRYRCLKRNRSQLGPSSEERKETTTKKRYEEKIPRHNINVYSLDKKQMKWWKSKKYSFSLRCKCGTTLGIWY